MDYRSPIVYKLHTAREDELKLELGPYTERMALKSPVDRRRTGNRPA